MVFMVWSFRLNEVCVYGLNRWRRGEVSPHYHPPLSPPTSTALPKNTRAQQPHENAGYRPLSQPDGYCTVLQYCWYGRYTLRVLTSKVIIVHGAFLWTLWCTCSYMEKRGNRVIYHSSHNADSWMINRWSGSEEEINPIVENTII